MTLSRFLRDYLYISLGGSRRGVRRQALALTVTMLLGGLWHGAGWTFLAWGGVHGLGLAVNHLWQRLGLTLPAVVGWALTMFFVFAAWLLFRADGFGAAMSALHSLTGFGGMEMALGGAKDVWIIALAGALAALGVNSQRIALEKLVPNRAVAVGVAMCLVYVTMHVGHGGYREFIYFQF